MQRGKRPERRPRKSPEEIRAENLAVWVATTRTGKLVQAGEITSIDQIFSKSLPILEPEIVDSLVPNLQEEVLKIKTVQRTTDAGRKRAFLVTAVIGNKDGYVGVGLGKSTGVRPAIERAMKNAKMAIISIKRGCGSWECGCGTGHSIPFKVSGKCGSVRITLMPAPKGTGIVAGKKAKKVLEFAGIKDVWSHTRGKAQTTFNFVKAVIDALKNGTKTRIVVKGEKK